MITVISGKEDIPDFVHFEAGYVSKVTSLNFCSAEFQLEIAAYCFVEFRPEH